MTIKWKKNPKVSWNNSKLKQKTQNSRKKLKAREDFPSPYLPSGVKKKPDVDTNENGRKQWNVHLIYLPGSHYGNLPAKNELVARPAPSP